MSSQNNISALHSHGDYVTTDAGQIYYEVEGEGPPVIIVPGGPGASHTHYHPWFSELATNHTVIYFDQLGTGRSDRLAAPTDYTLQRCALDIEVLRATLGFEQVSLVGLSFGSLPAIEYAITYTSQVSHLVLSNGHLNAETWQAGNIDNVNHELRMLYPERWDKLLQMRAQGVRSADPDYQALYDGLIAELNWIDPTGHPTLFSTGDPRDAANFDMYIGLIGDDPEWSVTGTMQGYDPSPALADFQIPTLIVTGRYDRVTPPAISYQILQALPEGIGQLEIFEHSSHRPWVEEPERYFDVVKAFLKIT